MKVVENKVAEADLKFEMRNGPCHAKPRGSKREAQAISSTSVARHLAYTVYSCLPTLLQTSPLTHDL
jgi:hypothetical protein